MAAADGGKGFRAQQAAGLAERGIGHDGHVPGAAPWLQIIFNAARLRMVEHLVGGAMSTFGQGGNAVHLRGIEIRDAPVADFAGGAEFFEGGHGLGKRVAAGPVQEVEIDAPAARVGVDVTPLKEQIYLVITIIR